MRTTTIASIMKCGGIATAALALVTVMASSAAAGGGSGGHRGVPEIDPGTAVSALSLALGGIAVLKDQRRKR